MLAALDRHPHARAVLAPALAPGGRPSHAYLFHGPGGAGKRTVAREVASLLLADGSADPSGARGRALSGVHPDLTWVAPSGAHEILVSDIAEPVISAASKTPFESSRRVFVIECADELGDEAANRMLKTLEEPAAFVHLILLTDRLMDVLPTIRSRCQLVRFDAPPTAAVAREIEALGVAGETALACARLSLGDASRARELALEEGVALRAAAERFARACLAGGASVGRPWADLLAAVRARGDATRAELEGRAAAEIELYPRKERKRVETEWADRIRRARRRVETSMLDLGLQLVGLWFADLAFLAWGAEDLVRNVDRLDSLGSLGSVGVLDSLEAIGSPARDAKVTPARDAKVTPARDAKVTPARDAKVTPARLRAAIELVEDTRQRFQLNVTEELACEALAYRLEQTLTS